MWYFLVSDAFTFAGFLIAYGALRFSMPTWPEPDYVFASFPFVHAHWPLVFVTFMTFVLIFSSVTMVRAVQEGHRENQRGVVFWMFLTVLGGAVFLGSQAYEWTTLIKYENVSLDRNPFGRYLYDGTLVDASGKPIVENGAAVEVKRDESYLLHGHEVMVNGEKTIELEKKFVEYRLTDKDGNPVLENGKQKTQVVQVEQGPKAFGALFFFITGFHGFHVFSGVLFLAIIMINAASGLYAARRNGYEMVEKIGLYWHFVDLVWVFVFLVFYLL
ncbi:MAG: cytochrome c oxidase subunit 3 [Chitinophagales bacterium]|nr:cytochrome c oxidase subunit 3 [Chitinophagales bacterium]